jgi:hypothetical protein
MTTESISTRKYPKATPTDDGSWRPIHKVGPGGKQIQLEDPDGNSFPFPIAYTPDAVVFVHIFATEKLGFLRSETFAKLPF